MRPAVDPGHRLLGHLPSERQLAAADPCGHTSDNPCPQGAYVWTLVYRSADIPGDIQKRSGTVTLLR